MLDKDKNNKIIPLECGCIFSFTDYFTSGIQDTTEEEHLLNKYGLILYDGLNNYSMNNMNIETWNKIKDMVDLDKICSGHFFAIINHIVKGTYEYYSNQREYMDNLTSSFSKNNNKTT